MYESKKTPGKKFGSIFAGKKYDENHSEDGMHSESPEHEAHETPEFEAGEQEGAKEHEAEMHEGEEHPMVDGHMSTSVHEHAHKAHDEARQLAAVPPAGKEENEEKDGFGHKDQGQQGAPSEEDGFSMPDLK